MMKILIVDDSKMARLALQLALPDELKETSEILEGCNGEEAVELYKTHQPNLVFLDLTMPVMNGYEALRRIIEHDPNAIVAVVSSDSQIGAIQEALKLGAKIHIKKPISAEVLQPILKNIL